MLTRRRFLATGAGLVAGVPGVVRATCRPVERVRLAVVGVAARGAANLKAVAHEEVVALCEIDPRRAGAARGEFPEAAFFTDARVMFDRVMNKIDAVVVSTPDHTHAPVAVRALAESKHVYCEKPLARSVGEVRLIRAAAGKSPGAVTQMGTQIHSGENYRRVVEFVQSGRLGRVNKVDVWVAGKPVAGRKVAAPPGGVGFDLDVWRGPADSEFFHATHPNWPHFHWRQWFDFGGGTLGDFGCHFLDLPFWALKLTAPASVESTGTPLPEADNRVPLVQSVTWRFPTAGGAELPVTWHHGSPPARVFPKFPAGVAFHAERGVLVSDYLKHELFDAAEAIEPPPPSIPKSAGHHQEWLNAIRGTGTTTCPVGYAGPLTEAVLLGNVAYRAGKRLAWDADAGTVDDTGAQALVAPPLRPGWF